jgi:hypothetical protein
MNSPMTTLARFQRVSWLVLWLALAGACSTPLPAQDFNIKVGGGNAEQAKTDKELADKLPPDQAAAFLKTRNAWSTVGDTIQWLGLLALPLGIVVVVLTFRHRRQKLAHETMRLMIEKGLPVPMELINPPPPAKPPKNDLRRGLIWLALGIGLTILLLKLWEDESVWALGLIPAFIGAAYLLCWGIGVFRERPQARRERSDLWRGIFWTLLGISSAFALRSFDRADGNWDLLASWWGLALIPIGIGLAFLIHALVSWWISRKQTVQG